MNNGEYDNEFGDQPDGPFDGITKMVTDAMLDRVVEHTCRMIATARSKEAFKDIYRYMTGLPVRAVLQMPKPLLDEFWKFVNHVCQEDASDNAAHGLRAMVNGYAALLNAEDQFQQDFHGLDMADLLEDYQESMRELQNAMTKHGETPADWAKSAFRTKRRSLPNPKGNLQTPTDTEDDDNE